MKLATDPVVRALAAHGPFGDVVDAGCGRGQLGLCLLEAGLVRSLRGFDWDRRKVEVAARAAGEAARFWVGDLLQEIWEPCDTLLLVDVLHYLSPDAQDRVLDRAAERLRRGGRVVVRDSDACGQGSVLAGVAERIAVRVRYNEGRGIHLRPVDSLVSRLEQAGLACAVEPAGRFPLSNHLVVALRR